MKNILEFLPLSLFLILARTTDTSVPENWNIPFYAGGLAALVCIVFCLSQRTMFKRIMLGINLYLLSGGLALITHQWWLNNLYGNLQASGMLLWVVGIGVVTLAVSPGGFVGVVCEDKMKVKQYSLYLLIASICAFLLSFWFRGGDRLLAEIIPFVTLFMVQNSLQAKLTSENELGSDSA